MSNTILYYLGLDDNKELILKEKFKELGDKNKITKRLRIDDIMTDELYENKILAEAFYKHSKDFYDSHKGEFPNYIFDPKYRSDNLEYDLYKFNGICYNGISKECSGYTKRGGDVIKHLSNGSLIGCDVDVVPKELYTKFIESLNESIKKYEGIISKKQELVSKYNKLLINN